MALVGNISGSSGLTNSLGITGSLIVANPGLALFPTLPDSNVVLFVSGNVGGTGKSVIGGDLILSGNQTIEGSSITTPRTTTFNFLNTNLTGTLNVGSVVTNINVGGTTTTSSFTGDIGVAGRTNVSTVVERMVTINGGTGTVSYNLNNQSIFYVNAPTGNITANFVGVPASSPRVITPTIIISQSASPTTARIVSAVQVEGVAQTLNWSNGVTPTGNQGKHDVFGFSLIRSGSGAAATWTVLGQMSSYG